MPESQNRRMLGNYSPCQNRRLNRRMFGNKNSFRCHVDFIVNQSCCFEAMMKREPGQTLDHLTVACHESNF